MRSVSLAWSGWLSSFLVEGKGFIGLDAGYWLNDVDCQQLRDGEVRKVADVLGWIENVHAREYAGWSWLGR